MSDESQLIRMAEALLFAAVEPLDEASLVARLPDGTDVAALMADLTEIYAERGIVLKQVAGGWAFRTAPDLAFLMEREKTVQRRLSRAAVETLSIIAYHQPITRAEIEEVRGVGLSKGTLDVLMESGWVRLRGRKPTPGRPLTYGTTQEFLEHFGLSDLDDLPGVDELKAAGLLSAEPPEELVRDAEEQAAASRGEKQQAEDEEAPEFDPDADDDAAGDDEPADTQEGATAAESGSTGSASPEEPEAQSTAPDITGDEDDAVEEEYQPPASLEPGYGTVPVAAKGPDRD
ncbi:MAG: SMC-Scp complex subunit ScpB [Alphaproteobacteria bacterium]